jgi:chromosomal replication initiator protein
MSRLDPRLTFDCFVPSAANRRAYLASLRVSEGTAANANPLFIYGPNGVGKTHLASAICSAAVARKHTRLLFESEEEFVQGIIEALRTERRREFLQDLAATQLLIIEDVHFLGGRVRTQEEFYEMISFARRMRCQLVLTADRPPREIPDIIRLLESFFESGLTVHLNNPDFQTLVKIVRLICSRRGLVRSDRVVTEIAQRSRDVRQVEGHLTRSVFLSEGFGVTPSR